MKAETEMSYEEAVAKLEQLVNEMESDNIDLEKAMNHYEAGMKLVKFCREKLEKTEKRITRIQESMNGEIIENDVEF